MKERFVFTTIIWTFKPLLPYKAILCHNFDSSFYVPKICSLIPWFVWFFEEKQTIARKINTFFSDSFQFNRTIYMENLCGSDWNWIKFTWNLSFNVIVISISINVFASINLKRHRSCFSNFHLHANGEN